MNWTKNLRIRNILLLTSLFFIIITFVILSSSSATEHNYENKLVIVADKKSSYFKCGTGKVIIHDRKEKVVWVSWDNDKCKVADGFYLKDIKLAGGE
jgi:hypothetical protein